MGVVINLIRLSFAFLVLMACSHNKDQGLERRDLKTYFSDNGITRYFLAPLPHWANFSTAAACQRQQTTYYMDLAHLHKSFDMDYARTIQFQLQYNVDAQKRLVDSDYEKFNMVNKTKTSSEVVFLPFQIREEIFYQVSERIQSSINLFKPVDYKQVHLVWIDQALSSEANKVRLKQFIASDEAQAAPIYLVSLCLSYKEMDEFIRKNDLEAQGAQSITTEMFAIYDGEFNQKTYLSLNFSKIFNPDQKLSLFMLKGQAQPLEFQGKFTTKSY